MYFTNEIQCLDLFSKPVALKTCPGYVKYGKTEFNSKWKYEKLAVVAFVPQITQNLVILCCFVWWRSCCRRRGGLLNSLGWKLTTAGTTSSTKQFNILPWNLALYKFVQCISLSLRTYSRLMFIASVEFQIEIRKISLRRSRSPKYAELGFFTLFCRGRRRNIQT